MNAEKTSTDRKYSMKVASKRTGLTPHAIRAWERRYGVINPQRDSNNRRYYTEQDIERLTLLREATDAGFPIGQISGYSNDELNEIVGKMNVIDLPVNKSKRAMKGRDISVVPDEEGYIESFLSALEQMDRKSMEAVLITGETEIGRNALLDRVVIPLMENIGELWRKGEIRISHEHLASHVMRTFLGNILSSQRDFAGAPSVVVTTPSEQLHEIGALSAAVTAASEGWNVTYLGPNLPAEEIAGAVKYNNSKVVILSLIYPENDPVVTEELRKLRRYLPTTPIITGGRARESYLPVLEEIGAIVVEDLYQVRTSLQDLRSNGIA
jgi:DNA-binding transcriptional MerR regulator/methylmalonyl-CoA mutase cobalamin-binding subunit